MNRPKEYIEDYSLKHRIICLITGCGDKAVRFQKPKKETIVHATVGYCHHHIKMMKREFPKKTIWIGTRWKSKGINRR